MTVKPPRNLTSLEYIVLGLMSIQPQSGYSIIHYFEGGNYSWSASPGSIYPMLKRLEKLAVIAGQTEVESEARQRRIYQLTPAGSDLLDEWLCKIPKMRPFYEQRELAMLRFHFMEGRLSLAQIIQWLDAYLDTVRLSDAGRQQWQQALVDALQATGRASIHSQLLMEASMMELNTLRTWLEMARARLTTVAIQTGEFRAVGQD